MARNPKTWIIIKETYGADTTDLFFTLGNGETKSYNANEENTLIIPATTIEIGENTDGIVENDTVVLDMTNIKSYDDASQYLQTITAKINVVLFVGNAEYTDEEFTLTGNEYILTFHIRQQMGTVIKDLSGVILNLYGNINLETIDLDIFKLSALYANDCPKLTGNLKLQYVTSETINMIDVGYKNSSTESQGITAITLPDKNIENISMTNCNVITKLTLPDSLKASLKTLNVNGCKKLGNFYEDGTYNTLDLSGFTALTAFKADNTAYISVKFRTDISTISMQGCGEFTDIQFSELGNKNISNLNLSGCSTLQYIPDLSTEYFSTTATINLSETDIEKINIYKLDLTYITYPGTMETLKIENSPYAGELNLSSFTDLTSLTLNSCGKLTSVTTNGNKSDVTLKSLTKCESITIKDVGLSEIIIGNGTNGNFMLGEFSSLKNLTITNYNIKTITLSSTADDPTLETLDLSGSNCKEINFPFDIFTKIQTLKFSGCENLDTFNGSEYTFSTNGSGSLINIDLTGTRFNTVGMNGSENIQKIILNNCSNLSELDFLSASAISELDLENCSDFIETIDLSISNFSQTSTINLSGTGITTVNIDNLDLTNIKYPEGMGELSINASPYNGNLDLLSYESLSSLMLTSCNSLTGFDIRTNVTTLNLASCSSLTGEYNIPNNVTTCSINNCGFTGIISKGEKLNLTLKALSQCTIINISNAGSSPIFIGDDTNGNFVLNDFSSLTNLTIINYTIDSVSISSTKEDDKLEIVNPTINLSETTINEININGLDLTDIKYPKVMTTLNIQNSPYNSVLDLSQYTSLSSLSLTSCNLTGFTITSNVKTLNLDSCNNLPDKYKIPDDVMTCSINNCDFTKITSDGEKSNITLKELSNCMSINIANVGSSNIHIGGENNGEFALDKFTSLTSLTITNYTISAISISSTKENDPLQTLNLTGSTCQTLNFPLKTFKNIQYIILNKCTNLDRFNNNDQHRFVAARIETLQEVDLLNTKFTDIRISSSPNVTSISIPSSVTYVDIYGLSGIKDFNLNDYKKLQYLHISNTGITSLKGEYTGEKIDMKIYATHSTFTSLTISNRNIIGMGFNTTGFSKIDCNSCSFIDNTTYLKNRLDLSEYRDLTDISLPSCELTTLIINNKVVNLNVNNNPLSGFTIKGDSTTNITSLTALKSINISDTKITSLVGEYEPEEEVEEEEKIKMTITATHNGFTSLKLQNRNIEEMNFNTTGFSKIDCNSCPFKNNTLDLSNYTALTDVTLINCGLINFTPNTSVENLDVSGNPFEGFIINNISVNDITGLTQLKSLNISKTGFENLSLVYVKANNTLTSINAESCKSLTSISLKNMNVLEQLKLNGSEITSLEYTAESNNNTGELKNISLPDSLKTLILRDCSDLGDQIDPSNMTALETFVIPNCNQSSDMTFSSDSLSEVDLSNNNISNIILSGIIEILNLENTNISESFIYSSEPTEPSYYGTNPSKLSTLKLAGTEILKVSVPYKKNTMGKITTLSLPSKCELLNISNQDAIEDLSTLDLSKYNYLSSFDLSGTKITDININSTVPITKAVMPTTTQNITFTNAMFAESLKEFIFNGENSSNLITLTLANTNITKLTCSSCIALESIKLGPINTKTREVTENTSLTYLSISDCDALETTSISSYSSITELYLTNCPELSTLSVDALPVLQNLELVNCNIFDGTSLFESDLGLKLPVLQKLKLENTRIQSLTINDVSSFETLTGTLKGNDADGNEIGLTYLDLSRCSGFTGITNEEGELIPFSSSTQYLENLNVSGCSSLLNLDISNCASLKTLNAQKSGISSITTSTSEQEALTEINMSFTGISSIDLTNYTNLQNIDLSSSSNLSSYSGFPKTLKTLKLNDTGISELKIPDLNSLSELKLDNLTLSTFSINGCKKLNKNYLNNLTINDSAIFKNLGSTVPDGISNIKPSSLTITETDWKNFTLNGELINNSKNSITIKLNNNLESLSFDSKPDSPIYKNLDISYNIKLKSINDETNILNIYDSLNVNRIGFDETNDYNNLNINLVMNAFTADDKTELPQYLGIWPQITNRYQTGDTLLGEINFIAAAAGKEVTGEFIGLHEETEEIENLLQYSFNNITVWDAGNYKTTEKISDLSFGPILSVYVADVDGNVPDDSVNISVNGEDMTLTSIIETMFNDGKKPDIIYTNDKSLEDLAKDKGIPVQILHTSTENWNPCYPYPNIFKIYFIMDNL